MDSYDFMMKNQTEYKRKRQFSEISSMLDEIGGKGGRKMVVETASQKVVAKENPQQKEVKKPEPPKNAGIQPVSIITDPVEEFQKSQNVEIRKLIDTQRISVLKELRKSQEEREKLQQERDYAVRVALRYKKGFSRVVAVVREMERERE